MKHRIAIPREVLLVEIERHCQDSLCNARVRIGLTKEEARAYRAFECPRCEQTWDDELSQRDVPDWWVELQSDIVSILSDDYRRIRNKTNAGEDSL